MPHLMCNSDALEVLFNFVEDISGDKVDVINGVEPVLQSPQRLPDLVPEAEISEVKIEKTPHLPTISAKHPKKEHTTQ